MYPVHEKKQFSDLFKRLDRLWNHQAEMDIGSKFTEVVLYEN